MNTFFPCRNQASATGFPQGLLTYTYRGGGNAPFYRLQESTRRHLFQHVKTNALMGYKLSEYHKNNIKINSLFLKTTIILHKNV